MINKRILDGQEVKKVVHTKVLTIRYKINDLDMCLLVLTARLSSVYSNQTFHEGSRYVTTDNLNIRDISFNDQ